ncbi:hypothetical protein MHYP_G00236050 [Metynnis hypsauchen]
MQVQASRGVGAGDSHALAWCKATGHSKKLNLSPLPAQSLSGEVYWCFVLSHFSSKMSGDLSSAGSSRNYAAYGYVECGPCVGKKQKAVKSCLTCLDSYCPAHLDLHEELHAGKKHKLINATGFLEDKICSRHEKLLEVFCCSDQQCICLMCTMDNHLGHTIVSAAAERTEKQSQLGEPKKKSLQMILEREKELAELQRAVDTHKRCAQAALQESEKIFDEMIRSIEKRRSEVQDLIKAQEKIAVSRAEVFLKQLEEEIAELRKRDEELQHLSLVEDHIHFLQRFVFLSAPPGTSDLPTITVSSAHSFDDVAKSVIQLKKRVDDFCKEDMERITTKVKQIQILTPMTREEVLQYFCDLTLDYNTAYRRLALYDGCNRQMVPDSCSLTHCVRLLQLPNAKQVVTHSHGKRTLCVTPRWDGGLLSSAYYSFFS